ncbi:MAG: ABC transporter permease, partial [Chloroflexi bacterium]|nr:ABC transporter permease [Chloroflexota bacterium]
IWSPSSRLSGNFAQVSAAVAENLALSLHLNHLTVVPAGGYKATETAWRIWQRMPDVQVLSPDWELAQARRERTALGLTFAGALLLAVLLSGPLWAEVAPRREMPKIPAAFAAGIVGFVAGWSIVQMVNAYCGHTLGLTPLQITPRLAAVVLALGTGLGLFTWQPFARWRRPLHYVVVILALAMCSAAQVAVGTLHESLRLSLNLAQRVATDWVTLHGARADSILLRDIARLPGIRGYAIEAYGGPANENDERWLGPLPASGLVYGLQLAGGEGTLSVPYRLGLWQGRPLQAEALHEAVIGFDLAQKWGLRVGDSLAIRDVMFTIVGIRNRLPYDPANSVNQRIDISLESLRRVWPESLATAEVTLLTPPAKRQEDKAVYLQEVASRLNAEPFTIAERLAEMARGYPATWTITRSTPQTTVRHAIGVYTAVRILFTVLLLAIGALVVAGAVVGQLATDESRVSMLQALGASESHLLGEYVQRAAVLGTVGTLLGLLGGYAVSVLLNRLGPAGSAELLFTPQLAASVFFLTVLTAMFAAVGPVIRTIRQDVAATLYTSSADNHVPAPSTIGVAPGGSQS